MQRGSSNVPQSPSRPRKHAKSKLVDDQAKRRRRQRLTLFEPLEPRYLLTVSSPPDQMLLLTAPAAYLAAGHFDLGTADDLVFVARSGQIDVQLNSNQNSWKARQSTSIPGPVLGATTVLANNDPFDDLLLQTANNVQLLSSDGQGNWLPPIAFSYTGVVDANTHPWVRPSSGFLGADLSVDLVLPLPQANQLAVFYGLPSGFQPPIYLDVGPGQPLAVAIGDIVGGPDADLVVGFADGRIKFLEGDARGQLRLRNDLTIDNAVGTIAAIEIADLDANGIREVIASGRSGAAILHSRSDPLPQSPIRNGDFEFGLTDWQTAAVGHAAGHAAGQSAGQISGLSRAAQLIENESFLTSLWQDFIVPENPQTIEFDLLASGLASVTNHIALGQLPDAFEVSLLDRASASLVPTHRPDSTAFFNVSGPSPASMAAGVTRNGTRVSLDIRQLVPGTSARLVFDLIGNPGQVTATATVDNVRITPDVIRDDRFSIVPLQGPFSRPSDLAVGDVDGDQLLDIVLSEAGLGSVRVYKGAGDGAFTRSQFSTSVVGTPAAIALGKFTTPDQTLDIAVAIEGSARALTPLVADTSLPTAMLVQPDSVVNLDATSSAVSALGSIVLQFSEPMFADPRSTRGSVTNPTSYRIYNFGPDGIDNRGAGDDIAFIIDSANYDTSSNRVTLSLNPLLLSDPVKAAGSTYRIIALGSSATLGLRDLAGNLLDGGQNFEALVRLDRRPQLAELPLIVTRENTQFELTASLTHYNFDPTYRAVVRWGDGTEEMLTGNDAFPSELFVAQHRYMDQGNYQVTIDVLNAAGIVVARSNTSIQVANVPPILLPLTPIAVDEGEILTYRFSASDEGVADQLTARVRWPDGSVSTPPGNFQSGRWLFEATYAFPDNGSYSVEISINDGHDTTVQTIPAIVRSVPPRITLNNATAIVGQQLVLASGAIADPGFDSIALGSRETISASVDWGDGSPIELAQIVGLQPGSLGVPTTAGLRLEHTYAAVGLYTVQVIVADDDGASTRQSFTVDVQPATTGSVCLPAIDFSTDAVGNPVSEHVDASQLWSAWGVKVSSDQPNHRAARVLTLPDPNGSTDHLLVVTEGPHRPRTDDRNVGNVSGTLRFHFDAPVRLDELRLTRLPAHQTANLRWFDAQDVSLGEQQVVGEDLSRYIAVNLRANGVRRLDVQFSAGGAISDLTFCREQLPGSTVQIAGPNSIHEAAAYAMQLSSRGGIPDTWTVNWGDGTVSSYAGTETRVTHTFLDGPAVESIFVTARVGNNVYRANELSVHIENVIPTLSIAGQPEVHAGESYRLSLSARDPGRDNIVGWLIDWGDGRRPQLVADNPTAIEYKYSQPGSYTIRAHAFDEDYDGPRYASSAGSLLQVYARGEEGDEQFEVLVNDQIAGRFVAASEWQRYSVATQQPVAPHQVKIRFINDRYEPSRGIDRNLIVDCITIDGTAYQTEAPDVYSTGTWTSSDGVRPGYRQSEWLHTDGYFHFDHDRNDGAVIRIRARGDEGGEQMRLLIDGRVVGSYSVAGEFRDFEFRGPDTVHPGQIRVAFSNDLYDPVRSIDRNLTVDYLQLNGVVYQTESRQVFSSGTWLPADGIQPGFGRGETLHTNGYFQFADPASPSPFDTAWVSNQLVVQVLEEQDRWLPTIDFERAAGGTSLHSGQIVVSQFSGIGMTVATDHPDKVARIFNTSQPDKDHRDLGSPNASFGGPGVGKGGRPGAGANAVPLRNVLVISRSEASDDDDDDHDDDDHDDEDRSHSWKSRDDFDIVPGTLIFEFEDRVMMDEVHLLNVESDGTLLRLFAADGALISQTVAQRLGTNSFQRLVLNATQVKRMEIRLTGTAAIAAIVSCRQAAPIPAPPTKFYVVDDNDATYRYSASGNSLGQFQFGNIQARDVTTTAIGNPLWILSDEGSHKRVYILDSNQERLLGSWTASGLTKPEGIATDGQHIWIVDDATNRVQFYAGAAGRRNGSQSRSSQFQLHANNQQPKGITTDGEFLWVVDSGSDRVFVYDIEGNCLNWWRLDPENSDATGLTINAIGDSLWVVDDRDDRVYVYSLATLNPRATARAISSFPLASGNRNPQGIADPGGVVQIGETRTSNVAFPGELNDWTFEATAGQRIYVNFQALSGGFLQSSLFAPDGSLIYRRDGGQFVQHNSGTLVLAQSGTYTLRLTSLDTPNYTFQIFDVPPPDVRPVTYGALLSGAIESPGREDQWTFVGQAGRDVYLDVVTLNTVIGGDVQFTIVAPNGAVLSSRSFTREFGVDQRATLPVDGVYRLVVRPDFNGAHLPSYEFRLWEVPDDDVRPVTFRETVAGAIEIPGARDRWTFSATAGQEVFLDFLTVTGGDLQVKLTSPSGALLVDNFFSLEFGLDRELILPESGTYTLTAQAAFGSASLNTYSFQVWDVPTDIPQLAVLNQPLVGSIVPGQTATFLIEAQANTPVLLDVLENSNRTLGLTLEAPDGTLLAQRVVRDSLITLPQSGTYRIKVQPATDDANASDAQGSYEFRLQDARSPSVGGRDSLGTRFYVAFPRNLRELLGTREPAFSLTVTSDVDTSGTVQIPGLNWYRAYDVDAGVATTIDLPAEVEIFNSDAIGNQGIIVTALDEVAVFGLNQMQLSTDGFTALPVDAIGQQYRAMAYGNTTNLFVGGGTSLTIVGTSNNTTVTVTPAVATDNRPAGVPFQFTIHEGQTYTYHIDTRPQALDGSIDLTGSLVTADKPIALFSGNTAAVIPASTEAADHLIEQMPPVDTWGSRFFTHPLATRNGGDRFRILAHQSDTQVRINGSLIATLAAGQHLEPVLAGASLIETSQPTLVAQFAHSSTFDGAVADPFMMLVSPVAQYQSTYTLTTPLRGFDANFANLIVPNAALSSLRVDGVPINTLDFRALGDSEFSSGSLPIGVGSHTFESIAPFGLSIYGFAAFESYGYSGGTRLAPLSQIANLQLSPNEISVPVNTQHVLAARVVDLNGNGIPGVRVEFAVSGTSLIRGVATTDGTGVATFTHTRSSVGTDTVTATVAGRVAQAIVNWRVDLPTILITAPNPDTELATGRYLLSGLAQVTAPGVRIAELLVNGRMVDTIDASGNFFTPVDIEAGLQTFVLQATDSLGQIVTQQVSFTGVSETTDPTLLANTNDISLSTAIRYSRTTFNRMTQRLSVDMQLMNTGDDPLDPTLIARLDGLGSPAVSLDNPDATAVTGQPLVIYDRSRMPAGLLPSETTSGVSLSFSNPDRDRLLPEFTVLAQANRAPRFTASPALQATAGHSYLSTVTAVDPDGQRLRFQLLAAPEGLTLDPLTGQLNWNPLVADAGQHTVAISASDERGGSATLTFAIDVQLAIANRPPVITSPPVTTVDLAANYRYATIVVDADQDVLSYRLLQSPPGMSVDVLGVIRWDNTTAGLYPVELQVNDAQGAIATQLYTLRVGGSEDSRQPIIVSTPSVLAYVASVYVYTPTVLGDQPSNLSFRLPVAPQGMQIDTSTGRITWRPTASDVGEHVVRFEAVSSQGSVASQSFSLSVLPVASNRAPRFDSRPVIVATIDEFYRYSARALDPEGQSLSYTLAVSPVGMSIDPVTGDILWRPEANQLGLQRVLVSAADNFGNRAFQQYYVDVRAINTPPTFVSTPIDTIDSGAVYRYDVRAIDPDDGLLFRLIEAPNGMFLDSRSGAITWQTRANDVGNRPVVIRAIDERGATVDQAYTLTVAPDLRGPNVIVRLFEPTLAIGQSTRIDVRSYDPNGVAATTLSIDGQLVQLDAQGGYLYTATAAGIPNIVATASDSLGNQTSVSPNPLLRVIDPSDSDPPTISLTAPANGTALTYLTDIVGSVDDRNLEYYELQVSPAGNDQWTTFSRRTFRPGTGDTNFSGLLGVLDPTMLPNDTYQVRLVAQDTNGQQSTTAIEVSIAAEAKIGRYRYDAIQPGCADCQANFFDLEVSLAGIPIRIHRSYDTLDANFSGDFGFGWRMAISNPRIRESVRVSPSELAGAGPLVANPFRLGTRVYFNAPDGRRVGFTFDPQPLPGLLGTIWKPRFVADPGVELELQVAETSLSQLADGSFAAYLYGLPYNPDRYTLVTKDRLRFEYDQFADQQLQSITDRNNVRLEYRSDGIYSSLGPSITWERDAVGRIVSITDPAGRQLRYSYDGAGDLILFENQIGEQTRMSYLSDPAHFLRSITDARGVEIVKLAYDDQGRIAGLTDALGNLQRHAYDIPNNTEVVTDPLGNESILTFDDRGNVTRVVDPLGNSTSAEFDPDDRPVRLTDQRGFVTKMDYDARGNLTQVIDALGQIWLTSYNDNNDRSSTTDPRGNQQFLEYDDRGNLILTRDGLGRVNRMEVDAIGRMATLTNPAGNLWTFEYGNFQTATRILNPDGTAREVRLDNYGDLIGITDENGVRITFERDAVGREIGVYLAAGTANARAKTSLGPSSSLTRSNEDRGEQIGARMIPANYVQEETDALGRVTRYAYDLMGRTASVTDPLGGVFRITFDGKNNVTSRTDARGNTTRYDYDANSRLTKITNAVGASYRLDYDEAGNLIEQVDPAGFITTHEYDGLNRRIRTTLPDGAVLRSEYDELGQVIRNVGPRGELTRFEYDAAHQLTLMIDPMAGQYRWEYDLAGNMVRYTDPRGNENIQTFDERNRLIARNDALGFLERFTYDGVGRLLTYTDQEQSLTTYEYDARGRVIEQMRADGGIQRYEYDAVGNRLKSIDPLGRIWSTTYDALNRPLTMTDPRGAVTSHTYDAMSNLVTLTDALNNTTRWDYDTLNRVVRRTDPLGAFELFVYDDAGGGDCSCRGNLAEHIDRLGRRTIYDYDSRNRNTSVQWQDAAGTTVDTLLFDYDASDNLTVASDADSQLRFTYDLNGRPLTADNFGTLGLRHTVLTNTWDLAGNRIRVEDNDGVRVVSEYDPRNLLSRRTWSGPGVDDASVTWQRNARGQTLITNRFADLTSEGLVSRTERSYDAVGRIAQISHRSAVDAVIAEYDLRWDVADQLFEWSIDGLTSTYSYDAAGQIATVDHARPGLTNERYSYDGNGNQTQASQVIGDNNRLRADDRYDYSYDAEGNLVGKLERATGLRERFTYDHANRMIGFEQVAASDTVLRSVQYRFDALGRRIARTVDADGPAGPQPASVETYVYDGADVWLDANASGAVTARYLHGDGVDEPLARYRPGSGAGSGTHWYLADHLGSVRVLIDASGNVADRLDYDSFGNIVSESVVAVGDRYKFTGREWDAEVGLYYYRARMYSASTGRFTSEDPIGFAAGDTHLSRYVGNMPTSYTDPSGLTALTEGIVGYNFGQQIQRAGTAALVGVALGYACGFLEGWYKTGDVEYAHENGLFQARVGAVLGASLGFLGASQSIWAQYFAGIFGLTAAAYSLASSEDRETAKIRTVCGAIGLGIGMSSVFRSRPPIASNQPPERPSCSSSPSASTASEQAIVSAIPPEFEAQLSRGGSYVMTEEQFLLYAKGKQILGRSDGQFMTSASEMNRIIAETGGDPVKMAQRLGLQNISAETVLIRMDVTDPLKFNPRMPSASMSGANKLFRPGGKTIGGIPEIVTDPLPCDQVWATQITPRP